MLVVVASPVDYVNPGADVAISRRRYWAEDGRVRMTSLCSWQQSFGRAGDESLDVRVVSQGGCRCDLE